MTKTAAATSARTEANFQFAKRSIRLSIYEESQLGAMAGRARRQGLGASFLAGGDGGDLAGSDLAGGVASLTGSPLARTSGMPGRARRTRTLGATSNSTSF